jgi:hypothetical protein
MGSWAYGLLGPWAIGPLGSWALRPLGTWAFMLLGPWALDPLGSWTLGLLGKAKYYFWEAFFGKLILRHMAHIVRSSVLVTGTTRSCKYHCVAHHFVPNIVSSSKGVRIC